MYQHYSMELRKHSPDCLETSSGLSIIQGNSLSSPYLYDIYITPSPYKQKNIGEKGRFGNSQTRFSQTSNNFTVLVSIDYGVVVLFEAGAFI